MVRRVWLLFLLLAGIATGALAADMRFIVQTDRKVLVLGDSLTLEVRVQHPQAPLNQIQLDPLKQNFDVYAVSTSSQSDIVKGRAITTEIMTLTLYPLHSGEVVVPALHYMDKISQAIPLSVLEDSAQISRVLIKSGIEPVRPWVRQAATLYLEIYDDGSLQWTPPSEIVAAGTHVRQLAETQREETLDGASYTVHRYAWAVTPLREGGVSLRFPILDAVKFGTHLRYAAAPVWLDVAPVPAYLPVHVPVGRPNVSIAPLPTDILLNRPVNWVLTVQGSGISEEGMRKLLAVLHDDENWHFYPASAVAGVQQPATTAVQTFTFVIPFQAVRAGILQLPELNLAYFDPEKGQIESLSFAGPVLTVVDPLWQVIWKMLAGFIVFGVMAGLSYVSWVRLRRVLKKRQSLLTIRQAASFSALRQALLDFDAGCGKTGGATLQQWLHQMEQRYETTAHLNQCVTILISAHYSAETTVIKVADLAQDIASSIQKLKSSKAPRHKEKAASFYWRHAFPEK